MRRMIPTTAIASLIVVGLVGVTVAQDQAPNPIDDVAAAEKPVPVTAPEDGRQVLVVRYRLSYEEGKVTQAEVVRSEQIASIAPKVGARRSGDWLVAVEGGKGLSFFTFDPGRREATPDEESGTGYEWVVETGELDWTLVVPLYQGDVRIEKVERITVEDAATGELLFETSP